MKRKGPGSAASDRRLANKKRKLEALLALTEAKDKTAGKSEDTLKKPDSGDKVERASKPTDVSGEEYEELRKRLRERKKALQSVPHLILKTVGQDASVSLPAEMRKPLLMRDLQFLLLYALMGTKAPVEPSRWCKFQQWAKLTKVVVMVTEGLGLNDYQRWSTQDQKFANTFQAFQQKLQFVSPSSYNSTVAEDLCILPLSCKEIANAKRLYGSIENAVRANGEYSKVMRTAFPIEEKPNAETKPDEDTEKSDTDGNLTKLLLTLDQLYTWNYPVPEGKKKGEIKPSHDREGFVMTRDSYTPVTESSPVFAVDCEMVITSKGDHELAAVCLMDSEFRVLYKSYVRPANVVTNYLTKFSGITPQMLDGINTKVSDVQEAIRSLLPPDAVLAGHSLENDLRALKLYHPYVVDTSLCYNLDPGGRSRKPKLRDLAKVFLEKDIQSCREGGHDPEEDAKATLELVHLKLKNGYKFGDTILQNGAGGGDSSVMKLATSTLKTVQKAVETIKVVGCLPELEPYKRVGQTSDHELTEVTTAGKAVRAAAISCQISQLTICHLGKEEDISSKRARKRTKKIWESLPTNSLMLTVWPGTQSSEEKDNPAFVGIGIKKGEIASISQQAKANTNSDSESDCK